MAIDYGPQRRGKSELVTNAAVAAYRTGRTLFIATSDAAGMLKRLRQHLPRDLFEIRPGGILLKRRKK